MSADRESNLTRIREIIGIEDPDARLPSMVKSMDLMIKRVENLEQRVRTLELQRNRSDDELKRVTKFMGANSGLLARLSNRFKKN